MQLDAIHTDSNKAVGRDGMRALSVMLRQRQCVNWGEKEGTEYLMLELHVNQLWN